MHALLFALQKLFLFILRLLYATSGGPRLLGLIVMALGALPLVFALPEQDSFPDITFKVFSQFIEKEFGSKISLATVLVVLYSLTENSELLNLHARQQNPASSGEKRLSSTGWMQALACAMQKRLGHDFHTLFSKDQKTAHMSKSAMTNTIGNKLNSLSKLLDLYPYDKQGEFQGKLKHVSKDDIEPVYMICPSAMECESMDCNSHSLRQTV